MKYRFLIVDDEPLARDRLRGFAAEESDLELAGEAGNGGEALRLVRKLEPDLVFMDIEMPRLSGMNAVQTLAAEQRAGGERGPLVIFTTAHAHHAVDAFAADAVDYLLKPFDQERFRQALAKARDQLAVRPTPPPPATAPAAPAPEPRRERILIKTQGRYVVVRVDAIVALEAAANYVVLHTDGAKHVVRGTLGDVLAQVGEADFFRIGRSHVVNLNHVQEVRIEENGQHSVMLPGGTRLRLSRSFRELQGRLESLHREHSVAP